MKILFVYFEHPPYGGGAGIVAQQILQTKAENTVVPVTIVRKPGFFRKFFFDVFIAIKLLSVINRNRDFGAIVFNDTESAISAGKWLSNRLLSKSTIIVHGANFNRYYPVSSIISDRVRLFGYAYRRVMLRASKIVCVSSYLKKELIKTNPRLKQKVIVSYCGLSKEFRSLTHEISLVRECKSESDRVKLLSVSRVVESKGYLRKIEIFKKLVSYDKDKYFWTIVGEGPFLDEIKRYIAKFDLQRNISVLGRIERSELPYIYSTHDLFWLLPSVPEAFGLVYLEAQACGISCIGSEIGGIGEAINRQTGLVTDLSSDIVDYITTFKFDDSAKASNVKFSSKFTTETFLRAID